MITIDNVMTLKGTCETITIANSVEQQLDAKGNLTLLPALIDVYSHLSTGASLENQLREILKSGINTVFEPLLEEHIPERAHHLRALLSRHHLPLNWSPLFQASPQNMLNLSKFKESPAAVVIIPSRFASAPQKMDELYRFIAQESLIAFVDCQALSEAEQSLDLAEKYNAQIIIHPITSPRLLAMIRSARERSQLVWAATNASLLLQHGEWLFKAIEEGQIELIHSGGEPTTFLNKLLQAHQQHGLSLHKIAEITRLNLEAIFRLPSSHDVTLINIKERRAVYTIAQDHLFYA